jgi:hypothetical protein
MSKARAESAFPNALTCVVDRPLDGAGARSRSNGSAQ